jgi:hypothetical protein
VEALDLAAGVGNGGRKSWEAEVSHLRGRSPVSLLFLHPTGGWESCGLCSYGGLAAGEGRVWKKGLRCKGNQVLLRHVVTRWLAPCRSCGIRVEEGHRTQHEHLCSAGYSKNTESKSRSDREVIWAAKLFDCWTRKLQIPGGEESHADRVEKLMVETAPRGLKVGLSLASLGAFATREERGVWFQPPSGGDLLGRLTSARLAAELKETYLQVLRWVGDLLVEGLLSGKLSPSQFRLRRETNERQFTATALWTPSGQSRQLAETPDILCRYRASAKRQRLLQCLAELQPYEEYVFPDCVLEDGMLLLAPHVTRDFLLAEVFVRPGVAASTVLGTTLGEYLDRRASDGTPVAGSVPGSNELYHWTAGGGAELFVDGWQLAAIDGYVSSGRCRLLSDTNIRLGGREDRAAPLFPEFGGGPLSTLAASLELLFKLSSSAGVPGSHRLGNTLPEQEAFRDALLGG